MSTSSEKQTKSLSSEPAKRVISDNWDTFTAQVRDSDLGDFALWLDEELSKMESHLEQFTSNQSRFSGRR